MKALTLTQPYATLVALRLKAIETRSWRTSYRGPLAIHAAAGLGPVGGLRGLRELINRPVFFNALVDHVPHTADRSKVDSIIAALPLGAIVATCELVDCRPITHTTVEYGVHMELVDMIWPITDQERAFGDYTHGRWAWLLNHVHALDTPIPAKGALGLWEWEPPA